MAAQPPPVHTVPPPQRFPLYADEPSSPGRADPVPVPEPVPTAGAGRHRRRRWGVWLGAGAAVALVVVVLLLVGGDDRPEPGGPGSAQPTTPSGSTPAFEGEPASLSALADASAPGSDADSVDISTGEPTTYEPANMLDGDPETAWRVRGDASGETLTFTFPEPVTLTSVGLVNGYAKTSVDGSGTEFDLYAGGRRVLAVEWVLDGGEPLPQTLQDGEREPQLLDVGAVEATVVELRLVEVSAPGDGPGARDTTAVSEVSLGGYAATS